MPNAFNELEILYFTYENGKDAHGWNFDQETLATILSDATGISLANTQEQLNRIISDPGHQPNPINNAVMNAEYYRKNESGSQEQRVKSQIKSLNGYEKKIIRAVGDYSERNLHSVQSAGSSQRHQAEGPTVQAPYSAQMSPMQTQGFASVASVQPVPFPADSLSTPRQSDFSATPHASSGSQPSYPAQAPARR
ncbi:hypothetical protein [Streptomyces sp. IB201691-2A2]|uniref:hypothetical protein n=1 Tax=Streptomyces sp. IB201691-2A2 TaxID=2561920 RepID=UPI00117D1A72|nr:hypothetical protein [Streptomyces sp. IB201691-2A2]TRO55829.1 hypothetical protein E4K73_49000 [Streptomyces sp. IB201691-2A2]